MGVGVQLKRVLQEQHKTIKQLSEDTGIPVNTLYSITKRDSLTVRPDTVQRLASALNVSPTFLIGFDEKIQRPEQLTQDEMNDLKSSAWAMYIEHVEETTGPKGRILRALYALNSTGQQVAVERVEELTKIPDYQAEKAAPEATTEPADGKE